MANHNKITACYLSPLQRASTVALGRSAWGLGRGKNKSTQGTLERRRGSCFFPFPIIPHAPVFSLQPSRSCIFLSLVFTNRSLCRGERPVIDVTTPEKHECLESANSSKYVKYHLCVILVFSTGGMRPRTRSLNPPQPVPNFGRKGHLWEDETHSRLVNCFDSGSRSIRSLPAVIVTACPQLGTMPVSHCLM